MFRHKHHVVQVMFCWTTRGVITTNRAGSVPDVVPHSSSGPIHTMNIRLTVNVLSADCSGDSVAAWTRARVQ